MPTMPLHMSASAPSAPHRNRLPPLNIMRSLSLCRKSRPTCTLSLANVSACKPPPLPSNAEEEGDAMQVDSLLQLDLSTIHFVAVPPMPIPLSVPSSSKSMRRTKTNTSKTKSTILNDINVIPFPTSAQTTTTTPSSTNAFKRQQFQKKGEPEYHHLSSSTTTNATAISSSSISPPRKRARKGSLTTTPLSPTSPSSRNAPSARVRALAQRVPPARPSTPTPDSRIVDDMEEEEIQDGSDKLRSVQQQPSSPPMDLVEHHPTTTAEERTDQGQMELPLYPHSPPPYSPPVIVSPTPMPIIICSPTPIIPLHVPIPTVPLSHPTPSSPILTSSTPPTSPPPPPLPPSPPPLPLPSPPPPSQQRKPRISPSDLKFFIFLYRTLISGLERRQKSRLMNTQHVHRARDGSRREVVHLDGVLVEVDDDDDDDDDDMDDAVGSATAMAMNDDDGHHKNKTTTAVNQLTPSLHEDLEAQDALLALRLRGFLKWNGVDDWVLKVDSSSYSDTTTTTAVNPFLEDGASGGGSRPDTMDVDIRPTTPPTPTPPPPMLSSRHLITVLRLRGTCGPRPGPGLGGGMKQSRENTSKLRNCCYQEGEWM